MENMVTSVPTVDRREISLTAVNVSQGGLRVETPQSLKESDLVRLSIELPDVPTQVTAFAEVIWANEQEGGMHFLAIHEDQENFLKEYVFSSIGASV